MVAGLFCGGVHISSFYLYTYRCLYKTTCINKSVTIYKKIETDSFFPQYILMLVHACVFLGIAVVIVLAIQLSFFPDNKPTKVWRNIFTKLRSFRLKIKKNYKEVVDARLKRSVSGTEL